ncbi:anosmin-1-like [Branchiostoma floridae]|uniref:Anosmin-1-like n=1 Tax=Branchiostoma floridae TaxID=7739 RepID=A0A9J7M0B1_BRAFL|nr:anosmin-1-like [Branchiostoma floridae]
MPRIGTGVLLGVLLQLATGGGQELSPAFVRARCASKCLSLHDLSMLEECQAHEFCHACLYPCQHFSPSDIMSSCITSCESLPTVQGHSLCNSTCDYLSYTSTNKQGDCPAPEDAQGFAAACVESCSADQDCKGALKCCPNGCGHTCQEPLNRHTGTPPRFAERPVAIETKKGQSIVVEWSSQKKFDHAVFLLQERSAVGKYVKEDDMSDWELVEQTTSQATVVKAHRGRWYQWRLAAVNENGTRGFSEPSKAERLRKDPAAPSPPWNLTEGDFDIKDGKISVDVRWYPPAYSDLPITRYRVYWSKRLKGVTPGLMKLKEHRKSVRTAMITLEGLEPDTSYFVQVQAFANWGDNERLRSDRESFFLSTIPLPIELPPTPPNPMILRLHSPSVVRNLSIEEPFFHHDRVKAKVYWDLPEGETHKSVTKFMLRWVPTVCGDGYSGDGTLLSRIKEATTHNLDFDIYDLRFDCHYEVRVHAVSSEGVMGKETGIRFYSPPCREIRIRGRQRPDCPTPAPDVPQQPQNLSFVFFMADGNVTGQFKWRMPVQSDKPVTGFRVMWGEQVSSPKGVTPGLPQAPVIDRTSAKAKMLPKDQFTHLIQGLTPGRPYVLQVQALSEVGGGAMAQLEFTVPPIRQQPNFIPPIGRPSLAEEWERKFQGYNSDLFQDDERRNSVSPQSTARTRTSPSWALQNPGSETNSAPRSSAQSLRLCWLTVLLCSFTIVALTTTGFSCM